MMRYDLGSNMVDDVDDVDTMDAVDGDGDGGGQKRKKPYHARILILAVAIVSVPDAKLPTPENLPRAETGLFCQGFGRTFILKVAVLSSLLLV